MTSYASFGTPALSEDVASFIPVCRQAGYNYAAAGHIQRLPVHIQIAGRDVQIVRSRHEWAKAFTQGWKAFKAEMATPKVKRTKRTRKAKTVKAA